MFVLQDFPYSSKFTFHYIFTQSTQHDLEFKIQRKKIKISLSSLKGIVDHRKNCTETAKMNTVKHLLAINFTII